MAGPKKPRLTQRERLLLKALAKGSTYAEAARAAGYSENNLRQSGFQAVQRIKAKLPDILDAKGLTDEHIVDMYLRPGLEAKETEFAKFNGKIMDSVDVIAWGPRLQALDMLYRLKGSYAPKEITGAGGGPIPIQVITNATLPHE